MKISLRRHLIRERQEGWSHESFPRRNFQGRENNLCKGPETGLRLASSENSKEASVAEADSSRGQEEGNMRAKWSQEFGQGRCWRGVADLKRLWRPLRGLQFYSG